MMLSFGCSSGTSNPASPYVEDIRVAESSSRVQLGIWRIDVDLESMTAAPVQIRGADGHLNVTGWVFPPICDDCINIVLNGFDETTRILDADMTLKNWTLQSGYDLRCIVYATEAGHELTNEDNWTSLFDISGGPNFNPFKAFAKSEANREFASNAQHTENFQISIPDPPQWEQLSFALDVSWPGNCGEPYQISNYSDNPINEDPNLTTQQWAHVFDWQDNVSEVWFLCPEVTGTSPLAFNHYVYQYWWIFLANTAGAEPGVYDAMIFAFSPDEPNLPLHHMVTLTVQD